MRRSICYCEPTYAQAGEVNTWKFIYTTATNLPKGSKLKFDLMSKGRSIDWEIPSATSKKSENVIYLEMPNEKVVAAKQINVPNSFVPQFEFTLPAEVPVGANVTIVMGAPKGSEAQKLDLGTRAQTGSQRRRAFQLSVDPTGKGHFEEPEVFTMDVRGGPLSIIRVLAPSFVIKNKRFDVIVRFEDEFGNLTNNADEDTLVELSYENIRENLNWKLFIPETGFLTLPNLYFNEIGVYTIHLLNTKTKETFRAAPIKCFPENEKQMFWGILHGESEKYDSTENIENCLRHFRDEKSLNFFAVSAFEAQEEISNEVWKQVVQNISDFDENERFAAFVGFQFPGTPGEEGIRQLLYAKENKLIMRKKDPKYNTLKKVYKNFTPKEMIAIPSFTMGSDMSYNFNEFDPAYERVVEIYNAWGSSECTKDEGNTRPIFCPGKKGVQETAKGSIQKALEKNCRFGFVAGGLDDRGVYGDFYDGDQEQYSPGLTAVIAPELSRQAIFDALYNRSCYATTGERIIVGFFLAGLPMGSEVNTSDKPGLNVNRHLSGYVAGTNNLAKVEIIRNGKVIQTYKPKGYSLDFTYDDMEPLAKILINAKDQKPPFVYYYIRATQEDGHIAWSSPIWVDFIPSIPGKPLAKKLPASTAKPTKTFEPLPEEDDDEEDLDEYTDIDEDEEE